jgi:hypothetical protein
MALYILIWMTARVGHEGVRPSGSWLRIIFLDNLAIPIGWSFASIRIYTMSSGYSLASAIEGSVICLQATLKISLGS